MKALLTSELLWGTLLIIFGISVLLKALLGIDLPIIRILFGGLLIYLGFSIISTFKTNEINPSATWFSSSTISHQSKEKNYRIGFSSLTIDLRAFDPEIPHTIIIDSFCSSIKVITNPLIPTNVKINATFASYKLPNNDAISCGNTVYSTHESTIRPIIDMQINLITSSLEIH
ncbi:hypothetical protein HYX58_02165 [Candidatus Dependentiae bacterium]|nr:hypothetical protein [Candidatus Dependentiae bacterium]